MTTLGDDARCYALVPCAGLGERAGTAGPKQYAPLAGRSVVAHALAALSRVERIVNDVIEGAQSQW